MSATSKSGESRSNPWINTDLTGGRQLHVPKTRQKYHRLSHKEILDGYDNYNTYVIVVSLRNTTNFVHLYVRRRISLEASRVVSRISHNNNNTTVLSILFLPYIRESYEQLFPQIKQL